MSDTLTVNFTNTNSQAGPVPEIRGQEINVSG